MLAKTVDEHMEKMRTTKATTKWGTGQLLVGENHWFKVEKVEYIFDCGGFVRYMLNETFEPKWRGDKISGSPRGMKGLSFLAMDYVKEGKNPNHFSGVPKDWMIFAEKLKTGNKELETANWELVAAPGYNKGNVDKIMRGDILIRSGPEEDNDHPGEHGHVMIAMGKPINGILRVADSTKTPHGSTDPRYGKTTGMGNKGEIKVEGNKVAWSVKGPLDRKLWVVRLKHYVSTPL